MEAVRLTEKSGSICQSTRRFVHVEFNFIIAVLTAWLSGRFRYHRRPYSWHKICQKIQKSRVSCDNYTNIAPS